MLDDISVKWSFLFEEETRCYCSQVCYAFEDENKKGYVSRETSLCDNSMDAVLMLFDSVIQYLS